MHALIIEHDAIIAMMIEQCLNDLGYRTRDIVGSVAAAIKAAELRCPDLITSDSRFDDGSGVEAVSKICSAHAIPAVFIVGDPFEIQHCPEACILEKPFTIRQLNSAVLNAVAQCKSGRSA